jgi:hypothetical protein
MQFFQEKEMVLQFRTTHFAFLLSAAMISLPTSAVTLLEENFDTTNVSARGWFDSVNPSISTAQHIDGSSGSLEMRYPVGAVTPATLPTPMRHSFTASDTVYIRYYVKYSDNWVGSQKSYHPHEFYLLTTLDNSWIGPSNTHFTAYIEQNGGTLQMGIQDSLNINSAKIDVDLTNTTESRGVAGCNGNPDGTSSDCYLQNGTYRNGRWYRSAKQNFTNLQGPTYKGSWHKIEAYLKFNSISNGKGLADGVMQMWDNGNLVIDRRNVIMRTNTNATMKFNGILIGPWIDVGSPVDQTTWIDNLFVSNTIPATTSPPMPPEIKELTPNP